MPQHDEHDDLAALDFSSQSGSDDESHGESDALDFSATADDSSEESEVEALSEFAPPTETEAGETELEAIAATTEASDVEEEEEERAQEFTVTNPAGTVSVSALMDGRIQRVKLSPTATRLTESELAEEITVLADLARQQGLAGTHTYLFDNESQVEGLQELSELGIDGSQVFRDFVEVGMRLPTPEQADAKQAEVFAARYTDDQ